MALLSQYLATADDLDAYADERRDADTLLPEILERLIKATLSSYRDLRFPNGRAILTGGWDGRIDCDGAAPYIPRGVSGWELTIREDQKAKADEDYDSRMGSVAQAERNETAFVHWNMRKWTKASEWAAARRAEGAWADVRAYDAVYLASWLCDHPAVHIWLTRRIGKGAPGVQDVFQFWLDWSGTPQPPFTPDLMLHGYENERESLATSLFKGTSYCSVQWEKAELALGFISAALANPRNSIEEKLAVRTVVVRSVDAFHDLIEHHKGLILVPTFIPDTIGVARERKHQIVVPLGRDTNGTTNIQLRSRTPSVMDEAMRGWEQNADRRLPLAARASTKFYSFYRGLLHNRQQPGWAQRSSIPLLLAGRWNEKYEGDREVLAKLSGMAYESVGSLARSLRGTDDPLVKQAGEDFSIVDDEEAWFFLGRFLDDGDLDRLEEVVLAVFDEPDPQYDSASEASNLAMFPDRGGKLHYSLQLRRGLCDAICYMGANGSNVNAEGKRDAATAAAVTVRRLFERSNTWQMFCSLAPSFTQLAEAAPEEFLTRIEGILRERQEMIVSLFRDKDDGGFFDSTSPHTYLLWGLETLSWSPDYVSRASLALARTAKLDPGGLLGNRPLGSLVETFLPWNPSTLADRETRRIILERISSLEPSVFWDLIKRLLPGAKQTSFPSHEARLRPWGRLWQQRLTNGDVWENVDDVTALALRAADTEPRRWLEILSDVPHFRSAGFESAVEKLAELPGKRIGIDLLDALHEKARRIVAEHKSFPDAEWSMSQKRLGRFEELLARYKPSSASTKWKWVFGEQAIFQLGEGKDFGKKDRDLAELRRTAAKEIVQEESLLSLLLIADETSAPWIVGESLAAADFGVNEASVLDSITSSSSNRIGFLLGFINGKRKQLGDEWLWSLLDSEWGRALEAGMRARIARLVSLDKESLSRIDALDEEARRAYWLASGNSAVLIDGPEILTPVVERLLHYGAVASAVMTLAFRAKEPTSGIEPDIALATLERAVAPDGVPKQAWSGLYPFLGMLLDVLDANENTDIGKLAVVEFALSNLLSHTREPKALNRLIAGDPAFFITLLKAVFRSRNAEIESAEVSESMLPPILALSVLEQQRLLPGQSSDGQIDFGTLRDYVRVARDLANESGRLSVCDERLGQWFSRGPDGSDGLPPSEAVRDLFEELESEGFEQGFAIGIQNSRGVFTKSLEEGGEQERELAAKYTEVAGHFRGRWPRSAKVFRAIAESYLLEARREDQRHGIDD